MYIVKLLRERDSQQEEYGRVIFDGSSIKFSGLTDIFEKYFQLGIESPDGNRCYPREGLKFITSLAKIKQLFRGELFISDITSEDDIGSWQLQ